MPERRTMKVARVYEIQLPDDMSDKEFVDWVDAWCRTELDESLADQREKVAGDRPLDMEEMFKLACCVATDAYDQGDLTQFVSLQIEDILTEIEWGLLE